MVLWSRELEMARREGRLTALMPEQGQTMKQQQQQILYDKTVDKEPEMIMSRNSGYRDKGIETAATKH
ncbi:hypothetical protein CFIMG_007041RA [Ceratocystis fimbriata CBS 114723]|uniref:Uncharacterized protein n=1 Tax=Ceratocystis fimbriata CBS 114723 TaxID=1035309 RepID=A0A2C5WTQ5_9PEZI|nr:hypothetical protein CFIMG_007041RA [Ceratocystis fimbriata CBS 114723]